MCVYWRKLKGLGYSIFYQIMRSLNSNLNQSMAITLSFRVPLGTQPNLPAFPSDRVYWSKPSFVSLHHWWWGPLWVKLPESKIFLWLTELLDEKSRNANLKWLILWKAYKTACLLLQLLNHDGEGKEKEFQNNCLLFLFSQRGFCDLFIRHNMCQLFNS